MANEIRTDSLSLFLALRSFCFMFRYFEISSDLKMKLSICNQALFIVLRINSFVVSIAAGNFILFVHGRESFCGPQSRLVN